MLGGLESVETFNVVVASSAADVCRMEATVDVSVPPPDCSGGCSEVCPDVGLVTPSSDAFVVSSCPLDESVSDVDFGVGSVMTDVKVEVARASVEPPVSVAGDSLVADPSWRESVAVDKSAEPGVDDNELGSIGLEDV